MLADRAPGAVVVDFAGGALLPGFVEALGHPLQMAETLAPPALDVRPLSRRKHENADGDRDTHNNERDKKV